MKKLYQLLFPFVAIAIIAFGNPTIGQNSQPVNVDQKYVKGVKYTVTLTETNFLNNETIAITVPYGNTLTINVEVGIGACTVYNSTQVFGNVPFDTIITTNTLLNVINGNNNIVVLNISTNTSVNNTGNEKVDFSVYPNPTKDVINIKSDIYGEYEIIDATGKVLMTSKEKTIDVSKLEKGQYYLRVSGVVRAFVKN